MTLEDLQVRFEHGARGKGEATSYLAAGFGPGSFVRLTETYPARFDGALKDSFEFERLLRSGNPATLVYKSAWGGLLITLPLVLSMLCLLWLSSGRTKVVFDPDERRVAIETRNHWLSRAQRRHLSLGDIAEFLVTGTPAHKGGTLYRPAVRLQTGEVIEFGTTGLKTPDRAEHWVAELRKLLDPCE